MPNSKNMHNKTSSSRTKARTSPDHMHPKGETGMAKGMGEAGSRGIGSTGQNRQTPADPGAARNSRPKGKAAQASSQRSSVTDRGVDESVEANIRKSNRRGFLDEEISDSE
jgi:hypothetical protein